MTLSRFSQCDRWILIAVLTCNVFLLTAANFTLLDNSFDCDSNIICLEQASVDDGSEMLGADRGRLSLIGYVNPYRGSGVAYYHESIRMLDPATRKVASFNSSFTFYEYPEVYNPARPKEIRRGDGMAFVMVASPTWRGGVAARLGIFGDRDQPKLMAVEYDNFQNTAPSIDDPPYDHVGVEFNSPKSNATADVQSLGLSLWTGKAYNIFTSWIEYDAATKTLEVRLANSSKRPPMPLLSYGVDLYDELEEHMWVGFSASNGDAISHYYVTNWTFVSYGVTPGKEAKSRVALIVGISLSAALALLLLGLGALWFSRRSRNESQSLDGMGMGMADSYSYRQLSVATKSFSEETKLGEGGFGSVYRGVLPMSGAAVAVKRVSGDSRQGEREFLAEVSIISQLRHRNVVQLLGYCRDKRKFLLVYELLPNGSLDKWLFQSAAGEQKVLSWAQRMKIICGSAAALHYLHEGWRQQVIHRDVKSSNIMLDDDFNAKLGDFGLARLVDRSRSAGTMTTMVAGTCGFLAPEASATGKFTDKTDVFAFGAVALEVVCGRTAFDGTAPADEIVLVDWVWQRLSEGRLTSVVDSKLDLQNESDLYQVEMALLLGLLCSHPDQRSRPSMRQITQVLAGDAPVPPVPTSKPAAVYTSNPPSVNVSYVRNTSSLRSDSIRDSSTGDVSIASPTTNDSRSFSSLFSVHGRKQSPSPESLLGAV